MILSKLILAGLFVTTGHTIGHLQKSSDLGVLAKLNIIALTEEIKTNDPIKNRIIQGAGFNAQDEIAKHFEYTNLSNSYSLANAIYKISYLVGMPKQAGLRIPNDLEKLGNFARFSVLISALSDLHRFRNPGAFVDIDFWHSTNGVPGLASTIKF